MLLNVGGFSWNGFIYTLGVSFVVFLIGLAVFNKTEKSFIDTV
jgi:lipopolysaccharide transport system permease protein